MKINKLFLILVLLLIAIPVKAADFTFGKTSDGASITAATIDLKGVSTSTPAQSGTIKSAVIRARLTNVALPTVFKVVLYSVVGGAFSTLLATSDEGNITSTTVASYTVNFSGAEQINVTAGTDYGLGYLIKDPGAANFVIYRDDNANQISWNADTYSDGATATFGTPSNLNGKIDTYVNASTTGRTKTASTTNQVGPINTGGTLVATIIPDNNYTKQVLIQRDGFASLSGWYLYIEDGEIKFQSSEVIISGVTDGIWSGGTIATSTPYSIALSYAFDGDEGANPTMCVNGAPVTLTEDSTPDGIDTASNWATLYVAGRESDLDVFTGQISDVYYIADDLTGNALCNLTAGVKRVGLSHASTQHYWPMDEYAPGSDITGATTFRSLTGSSTIQALDGVNSKIVNITP